MNPITEGHRITLGYDYFASGFSGAQLSDAYYRLIADKRQEQLLLETASLAEVEAEYNPGDPWDENDRLTTDMVLEAIRIQKFARTETKMLALIRVFNSHMKDKGIEALAPDIGKPRRSGLFATVTVQIPFSDGQVLSIIFHSPDNDNMKITPDDEIIAFRWLLNKRDITQVVSPEFNAEVSLQEISKRVSQLVEKNSARFQASQKALKEQRQQLEETKAKADEATAQQAELMDALQVVQGTSETLAAQEANLEERVEKQKSFNEDLQAKIDALKAKNAGNDGKAKGAGGTMPQTVTLRDGRTVLAREYEGSLTAYTYANNTQANAMVEKLKAQGIDASTTGNRPVYILINAEKSQKADQEAEAFKAKAAAFATELTGRGFKTEPNLITKENFKASVILGPLGSATELRAIMQTPYFTGDGYVVYVSANSKDKSDEKQFKSATVSGLDTQMQNALAWIDKQLAAINKDGSGKKAGDESESLDEIIKAKFANRSNASLKKALETKKGNIDDETYEFSRRMKEAGKLWRFDRDDKVTVFGPDELSKDPIGNKVWQHGAETIKALPEADYKKIYEKLEDENYHSENMILMAKRLGNAADVAEAEALDREQRANGSATFEMTKKRYDLMKKLGGIVTPAPEPEPKTAPEQPAIGLLNDIVAGKYGKDTKAIDKALDDAAEQLEKLGLMEKYDALLNQAADALTVILKEKAKGLTESAAVPDPDEDQILEGATTKIPGLSQWEKEPDGDYTFQLGDKQFGINRVDIPQEKLHGYSLVCLGFAGATGDKNNWQWIEPSGKFSRNSSAKLFKTAQEAIPVARKAFEKEVSQ